MITITLKTGETKQLEADDAKIRDGWLIVYVLASDRQRLESRWNFRVDDIRKARLEQPFPLSAREVWPQRHPDQTGPADR